MAKTAVRSQSAPTMKSTPRAQGTGKTPSVNRGTKVSVSFVKKG